MTEHELVLLDKEIEADRLRSLTEGFEGTIIDNICIYNYNAIISNNHL